MDRFVINAIHEIEKEMLIIGFIDDSDDTDRLIDEIADDLIPIEEDERENLNLKEILEDHLKENYRLIKEIDSNNNYKGYYYDTEKVYDSIDQFKRDYEIR